MQILAMHGVLGLANEQWLASGRVQEGLQSALRSKPAARGAGEAAPDTAAGIESAQSIGQQLLLLDRTEEASEHFERCLRDTPLNSRNDQRARSCLIAGFQAMHHHQLRTAWSCFQRAGDAKDAPLSVTVEAYGALAALYFHLGMRRPAAAAADRALTLLCRDDGRHHCAIAVLSALKIEFVAMDLLRQHERLDDLAFWPRHDAVAGQRIAPGQALAMIGACRRDACGFDFVLARLDFLEALIRMAYEDADAEDSAMAHIEYLSSQGLHANAHAARHEFALACIAARRARRLRQLMEVCAAGERARRGQQHELEHDYCLAKLGELSGGAEAYITHYRNYAVQSLLRMRQTCAYITVPSTVRQAGEDIARDDVASRLHGRYRHAYQFILANLQREDLSIRDVANEIGVTERALQLAFRSALGMSPSAVIRQCRLDRIRDDLSHGPAARQSSTLEIGRRWGLRSRSAMSQAYKTAFGELPSKTEPMPLS